ncbi:GtrA family protein [Ectopseudomonas hydrolytica]|uniref:GtrA family protein n=1 Tax=Ectopseudomonas hydrolytica TaxID=2493633 RepID=A0ABY5A313_9GAMM|nr:GtrA family protein [Pseudomonas hydrolytica]OCX15302.1 polysaccharide biosynthesis protein GtrA [Stutzerimonas xanthomarina]USR37656.1 GtrA family protein [Pseudomonas hydrolytica]
MSRELFWFGVVGGSAMFVHFSLVSWLLVPAGLSPLVANILGFLLAFKLSYWGHRLKTFNAHHVPHVKALPRFFLVASLSFALNETLYFLLLRYSQLDYREALLLVLFVVAAVTFLLGRFWAFQGVRQP